VCVKNMRGVNELRCNVNRIHFVAKLIAEINATITTTKIEIIFFWL